MKWIFSLVALSIVLSSCATKPYMVGSVNEMWYKRWRQPGAGYKKKKEYREFDYSWQPQVLQQTAKVPMLYRENLPHTPVQAPAPAPVYVPYTSSK